MNSQWQTIALAANEAAVWSVENSHVYVQRIHGDWMLAKGESIHEGDARIARKIGQVPLNLDWTRWTLQEEASEAQFVPCFPDKPLVVKTRVPVIIPPKTSVELFVNLPIWLEVAVKQGEETYSLQKIAPMELSQTWYGNQFEGELCYAVKSRARRSIDDLPSEPLRAACLFKIRNRSNESLPVERMRILTSRLSLYEIGGRMWTNSVTVTFRGDDSNSEVRYDEDMRLKGEKAEVLRVADKPGKHGSVFDKLLFNTMDFI